MDPCLLHSREGIIGLVVDDSIFSGTPEFIAAERSTMSNFQTSGIKRMPYKYNGVVFEQSGSEIHLHQRHYIESQLSPEVVQSLTEKCDIATCFQTLRGRLMWLAINCRPDLLFTVATNAQITNPDAKALRKLVKEIAKAYDKRDLQLRYAQTETPLSHTYRVIVFTDASRFVKDQHGDQPETVSQLGYVVWFTQGSDAYFVTASSYKSPRKTNSVLAAETFAFSDGFQRGHMLRKLFEDLLHIEIPLDIVSDSKSLVDAISTKSISRELMLMNHLDFLRQAFRCGEIGRVGHTASQHNYADALTKNTPNPEL